jgi:MFS family permease
VVLLFACVLGLESADLAAVGAAAPQLRGSLGITNAQLGLLAAASTLVGAIVTVPFGVLADRIRRVDLLAGAVGLWGVAMVASAAAQSYDWLLLTRLGLGAVTGAAAPAVASLMGDLFAPAERAKIYGYVLSGELVGAGFGFVISGSLAAALSWRWAFAALALPAGLLVVLLRRALPEPARGGQSRLELGAERVRDERETQGAEADRTASAPDERPGDELARRAVAAQQVSAAPGQVLHQDPATMRLTAAVRYVLSIRTNRWLIVASAVGYFFFAGLRTFGLAFVRGHFGLGQTGGTLILFLAGLGSLIGVLVAGRLADRLIRNGTAHARVLVAAVCYLGVSLALVPSLLLRSLALAIPLLVLVGALLSAPNPPLDAARLDIMPSGLWGRAEGVRTLLRQSSQAAAPVLFGLLADELGGPGSAAGSTGHVSAATARGLRDAFLIMLVPLGLNGLALLKAKSSYPTDVATAADSERSVRAGHSRRHPRGVRAMTPRRSRPAA